MRLIWWRKGQDRELREEVAAHIRMAIEERVDRGQDPASAEADVRAEFGNELGIRERTREEWGWIAWEQLAQDVKYAIRGLRLSPGFSAGAIAVVALGIGVNTFMFSVVSAVLLKPLPYTDADRLMVVQTFDTSSGGAGTTSPPDFYTARRQNHSFDGMAAFYQRTLNLTNDGEAERVQIYAVSGEFFKVLDLHPSLGRDFAAGDELWGAHRVAILTDALWKRRYGSDAKIVGRTITLDGDSYTVIGVMPPEASSFAGVSVQMYLPMSFAPGDNLNSHNNAFLTMVARLRPKFTLEQANADLKAISAGIEKVFPENKGLILRAEPLRDAMVSDVSGALWVLMGAVTFVLMIACANLANLLLTRAVARTREVAVRAALGASRSRLVRQFVTESTLLCALGAACGLALANWGIAGVHSLSARVLPRVGEVAIDTRVLE